VESETDAYASGGRATFIVKFLKNETLKIMFTADPRPHAEKYFWGVVRGSHKKIHILIFFNILRV